MKYGSARVSTDGQSVGVQAEDAWNNIVKGAEGANPSRDVRIVQPRRLP